MHGRGCQGCGKEVQDTGRKRANATTGLMMIVLERHPISMSLAISIVTKLQGLSGVLRTQTNANRVDAVPN
jgi:hypothetical protein